MRRRTFITLLGGAALAWPFGARAQQAAIPVIGVLSSENDDRYPAFYQGLSEGGYADGRNVRIEYHWAAGRVDRYPEFAADLVRRQVAVIAALGGIPAATAAKAATATIPIVFTGGFDPVEIGLIASFSRPAGNLTGVSTLNLGLGPKRLEIMHELIPAAKVFALLLNPEHPNAEPQLREMQTAARARGLELRVVHARNVNEFGAAFEGLSQLGTAGLVIGNGQPFAARAQLLGELAARHRMLAVSESREFVAAGGLVSYAGNSQEAYRLAGVYIARILKGEKPADLPVQQVTKVELFLNIKVAKSLGVSIPLSLLGRADEVIE